ncbi:large subunit ribosomal protein L23 [Methylomarinovum caldicuralii]|uniref:Large ribosomal subunit protein uL23 n=1 Tax=Methylomarinovum caldicuralii TaxID=438856 RepID=A0AAU9BZ91_9GAMM|nr:50S ribosomal protein L23 [Methylomarinovum caldicuralii]BCX80533.1 large subunit ribosomal protein L23 [Methylomarinovum caldicuralii]
MSQLELMKVLVAPVISEKSTRLADSENCFVFKVRRDATKFQVKKAVEQLFDVEVDEVRLLNMKGKTKRFGRIMGKRPDWKKAYVRLKPGHEIDLSAA